MSENAYASDVAFLRKHTEIIELVGSGDARVAVAPGYQGRVMTSSLAAEAGASFGWLNEDFIAADAQDEKFNNYGGEDRFWLGPEAGQFGLWFENPQPFDMEHWKTPAGLSSGTFRVTNRDAVAIEMASEFAVTNYSGTRLDCAVKRTIRALAADQAAEVLGTSLPDGLSMVGFGSRNALTNAGSDEWTQKGGMASIWILGQFKPLPRGKVIVPFVAGDAETLGPRATTDYFGQMPPERCVVGDDHLLFSCDGQFRSKIGVSPARARNVLGSYDPQAQVLTIVQFNLPADPAGLPYVNSLWEIQDAPFAGDAVNSYNDGEETPGAGQLGPFYEIETSSPAAALAPGESITHEHNTFHFAGNADALDALARQVLAVGLDDVR